MPKYTASIFLVAAVFFCSSLAYPFYESDEFIPSDEGKLRRDEERERQEHEMRHGPFYNDEATLRRYQNDNPYKLKVSSSRKHKREPDTEHEEAAKMLAAADITSRVFVVHILVNSVKESEREGLRKTLEDAAMNQHWNNIDDFIAYALKTTTKVALHSEGIEYNESYFDFSVDSSNEA